MEEYNFYSCKLSSNLQSQGYVRTDGQSESVSWCEAPIWGPRRFSLLSTQLRVCWCGGALFDERTGLSFTIAAGSRHISHSRVRVPLDLWPILLYQVGDSRNLEGQVPVFTRGLLSLWLYKENNKLQNLKNVFTLHIPLWVPYTLITT
jgi:hypothetical protein